MNRLVLEASAALRLIADRAGPGIGHALAVADDVVVPSLFCAEVGEALRAHVYARRITAAQAAVHLEDLLALAGDIVPESGLMAEALSEACRLDHPVRDAVYVVLARRLGAPLATCDARVAGLASTLGVPVIGC